MTICSCTPGGTCADFGATPDEELYYHYHPGAHPDLVNWLLNKEIHVWGVDCVSTDHPMNLPIGRFLVEGCTATATGFVQRSKFLVESRPWTGCSLTAIIS